MIFATPQKDVELQKSLEALTSCGANYWSFKGNSQREYSHGFFQYPAMMVPQMVRVVLEKICEVHPEIRNVNDPFVGSGTILTESIMRGLNFAGQDINPLAVLLCLTKVGPFYPQALEKKLNILKHEIEYDNGRTIETDFPNKKKWFSQDAQVALSKICRGIKKEPRLWARRFFWVALAETARLVSNTRTSTFKLHIREEENIKGKNNEPIILFKKTLVRNFELLKKYSNYLKEKKLTTKGKYKGRLNIFLADTRLKKKEEREVYDIIITSPPYGDNATTVPYGQFSYLPLQWIDLSDIHKNISKTILATTHEIDTRSLGGMRQITQETIDILSEKATSFRKIVAFLKFEKKDRINRVAAFFRDLERSLGPISNSLRPGGIMVWTIGNRRVGGIQIPLDRILKELLEHYGIEQIAALQRQIHSKRMAKKNNIVELMNSEAILVFRKEPYNG